MGSMQNIVRRIFSGVDIPEGMSKPEFQTWMDARVTAFEDGGFMENTKLTPIVDDDGLVDVLAEADPKELLVVKFYKRGCLPCLSIAEAYKNAELKCRADGLNVRFLSINSKLPESEALVQRQLVSGTPTVQTFVNGRQIGDEIQEMSSEKIMEKILSRMPRSTTTPLGRTD